MAVPIPDPRAFIQLQARGLLGFLQLKTGGQDPQSLVSQLQGVLELRNWYMETNSESFSQNALGGLVVGENVFATMTVPAREIWFVHDLRVSITTGAGQTAEFCAGWLFPNLGGVSGFAVGDYVSVVANSEKRARMDRDGGFFAIPGGGASMYIAAVAGAPTANAAIRITRLPI